MPNTLHWTANAPKIAQVTDFLFAGTWEANDIVICTIGGKSFSTVTGSTTISTIVDTIVTAWNALSADNGYPEFAEITASRTSNTLRLTMDTAGKPFTCTVSTTETGGGAADSQTIDGTTSSTGTNSTANSGPNVVSLAGNWGGTAPADGDMLIFDQGNVDCLYDLDQNAITPAAVYRLPGYTGNIGLPVVNIDDPTNPYAEYRECYLRYGNSGDATNMAINFSGNNGTTKFNAGTSQATFRIEGTGTSTDSNVPACLLKGTHASNELHVSKGDVGFAFYGTETGTLLKLNVGYQTTPSSDSTVRLGIGVTLTAPTITVSGGSLEINSAITSTSTVVQSDGIVTLKGTGGVAAGLVIRGGDFRWCSTGTLGGAPVVSGTGHLDYSQDLRTGKAITNPVEIYGGEARFSNPNKVISSLVLDLNEGVNSDNLALGSNIRLTVGTPS